MVVDYKDMKEALECNPISCEILEIVLEEKGDENKIDKPFFIKKGPRTGRNKNIRTKDKKRGHEGSRYNRVYNQLCKKRKKEEWYKNIDQEINEYYVQEQERKERIKYLDLIIEDIIKELTELTSA